MGERIDVELFPPEILIEHRLRRAGFSPPAPPTYARPQTESRESPNRCPPPLSVAPAPDTYRRLALLLRSPINERRNLPMQRHAILVVQIHHVPRRVVILFDVFLQRVR
jgi:hypothetical protein